MNVSDPQDPHLVGHFDTTGFEPYEMIIKGKYGFVAGRESGVHILDLSDPIHPEIIASYPVNAFDIHAEGQLLFVAADDSLVILRAGFLPVEPGDANGDGAVSVADIVYLINYLFKDGPEPPDMNLADVNADCRVSVSDVVYLINYLFKSGPAPQQGCAY